MSLAKSDTAIVNAVLRHNSIAPEQRGALMDLATVTKGNRDKVFDGAAIKTYRLIYASLTPEEKRHADEH